VVVDVPDFEVLEEAASPAVPDGQFVTLPEASPFFV
jgi:hypothetical protein